MNAEIKQRLEADKSTLEHIIRFYNLGIAVKCHCAGLFVCVEDANNFWHVQKRIDKLILRHNRLIRDRQDTQIICDNYNGLRKIRSLLDRSHPRDVRANLCW